MSLFKSIKNSNGRLAKLLVIYLAALPWLLFLGACGFSPIYAQNADNYELAARLATVEVKPGNTLLGQKYVNALQDILDPANSGATKEYSIKATIGKNVLPLAIERDRTVTRFKVVVTATYEIRELASDKIISAGTIKNEANYDNVNSDYATFVSENDTSNRVVRELAQDTKIKIIAALLN